MVFMFAPPANIPLVGEEHPPAFPLTTTKSPKSIELPEEKIVIY